VCTFWRGRQPEKLVGRANRVDHFFFLVPDKKFEVVVFGASCEESGP
jgi:hypothetical protein